tara:strand:- start:13911 stop:14945 length:1035 start_codon:yes stop_codon:yes gene_type:complete
MKKVLIFGSGSIGNHMAFACRKIGMDVFITDISSKALNRMKNKIYPMRYKKWDKKIKIINYKEVFNFDTVYDLIIIGSPPETHLKLYFDCKNKLKFKKILIEKPISNFSNKLLKKFNNSMKNKMIFCGYNHSISLSFNYFKNHVLKYFKVYKTLEINWKEGWDGILGAHFWLKNEFDTYLGNIKRGGGALQEHSHGLHLMLVILKILKVDYKKLNFKSNVLFKKKRNIKYDMYSNISAVSKNSLINYESDLKTFPAQKNITIINDNYKAQWKCNYQSGKDCVNLFHKNKLKFTKIFKKTRSSEFENELKEILSVKNMRQHGKSLLNPLYAVDTIHLARKVLNGK